MIELASLIGIMELLRKRLHKDMPLQQVALLLAVAETPGISMPELMKVLNMPQGSVSRNVKTLSGYIGRENGIAVTRGYDMVRTEADPNQPRARACFLTPRGEALIRDLTMVLRSGVAGEAQAAPVARNGFPLPVICEGACQESATNPVLRLIQLGSAAN